MYKNEINLIHCQENLKRHKLKIALIFPNSYFIGMSNLGVHRIYELLCKRKEFFIERIFFEDNQIILNNLKDRDKLKDFDIIFFSISYVNDIDNAKKILKLLNLKPGGRFPLLIAGGIGVSINPENILNSVDYIFRGEAEGEIDKIIDLIINFKYDMFSFEKFNKNIIQINGLTDSQHYSSCEINIINELKNPAHTVILTSETEFKNTFLIEITRSCRYKCKFCFIGNNAHFRFYPQDKIINKILYIKKITKKVGLVGSDVLSHPDIFNIYRILINEGFIVSFSSFRADRITEEFIRLYSENGNKSLTIAPETGSSKLKKIINKNIPNEKILKIANWVAKYGLKKLKLYLLIGLPEETENDIKETINLIINIKKVFLKYRKKLKYMPLINLSINQFIPQLNTPFESFKIPDRSIIKQRAKMIRKFLRKEGNIKLSFNLSI